MHLVRGRALLACMTFAAALVPLAGAAEELTRSAEGVTRLHFDLPGELIVRQSDKSTLTVHAEPRVLARLRIVHKGDLLTLTSSGSFSTDKPLRIIVGLQTLRELTASNSGNATIEAMRGKDLQLTAAGTGNLLLKQLAYDSVNAELAGSCNVTLSGTATRLQARISGTGTIDAADLAAKEAAARLSGSGEIRVHASQKLDARLSGAGRIAYRGKPALKLSVTGAGSIDRL